MRPLTKIQARQRRHLRLRQWIRGSAVRPRMSVCFTGRHVHIQFIDDVTGHTVAAISSQAAEVRGLKANLEGARKMGALAAHKAKEQNITRVVFDRGGFQYHGRVKALADAAREAGLVF